MDVIKIKKAK